MAPELSGASFPEGETHLREVPQVAVLHVFAKNFEWFFASDSMWHLLYFFPLPHQQGSFLPKSGMDSGSPEPKRFLNNPKPRPPSFDRWQAGMSPCLKQGDDSPNVFYNTFDPAYAKAFAACTLTVRSQVRSGPLKASRFQAAIWVK